MEDWLILLIKEQPFIPRKDRLPPPTLQVYKIKNARQIVNVFVFLRRARDTLMYPCQTLDSWRNEHDLLKDYVVIKFLGESMIH